MARELLKQQKYEYFWKQYDSRLRSADVDWLQFSQHQQDKLILSPWRQLSFCKNRSQYKKEKPITRKAIVMHLCQENNRADFQVSLHRSTIGTDMYSNVIVNFFKCNRNETVSVTVYTVAAALVSMIIYTIRYTLFCEF